MRDHHLPGGRRPIHTLQALPVALAVVGRSLDELARRIEANEQGIAWHGLREVRAGVEQQARSLRSIAAKVERALLRMDEEVPPR